MTFFLFKMSAPMERKTKHIAGERGGLKRRKDALYKQSSDNVNENSLIVAAFRGYHKELDKKHDKHERLVKLSRDVTIQSKRVIFLLHRISSEDTRDAILKEADEKIEEIGVHLKGIAMELEGEDPYRFLRAYTNGLQEYIEAISFHDYLLSQRLLTLESAQVKLTFNVDEVNKDGDLVPDQSSEPEKSKQIQLQLPPLEYVLGLADLTGELMRCCINSIGNGNFDKPFELLTFMRDLYEGFSLCSRSASRELRQKMETMRQSLMKVENTCYTLQVRGSEMPQHMLLDAVSIEPQAEPSG